MNQNATDHIRNFHKPGTLTRFIWSALLGISIFLMPAAAIAFDQSHKLFGKELKKYVRANGVLYAKWKTDLKNLDKYLNSLSLLSAEEYEKFSTQEKKAFWLNAYNALAVKLVLDHYPIKGSIADYPSDSIRQIPNTWEAVSVKILGKEQTLYTIAHDILRREHDCRTHFGIVPAARGGSALQNQAFEPKTVDAKLDELTNLYLSKQENLNCNLVKFTINVSRIFKWFPLDFMSSKPDANPPMPKTDASSPAPKTDLSFSLPKDDDVVRDYVTQFLPKETRAKLQGKEMMINYIPYDWSLNDADQKKPIEQNNSPD